MLKFKFNFISKPRKAFPSVAMVVRSMYISNDPLHPLHWYTQSGLLMHRDRFYSIMDHESLHTIHQMDPLRMMGLDMNINYPILPFCPDRYVLRITYHIRPDAIPHDFDRFYAMHRIPGNGGYAEHMAGRTRDYLTPPMRRIQRWLRAEAQARIKKRRQAVAMGLHDRLGQDSPFQRLGSDLVWHILSLKVT